MRRYLVVDDNKALAENVAEIIEGIGDEVSVATSGAEALALARAGRYDALITDMRMPQMGGAALVHAYRKLDPGIPAIVLTAFSEDADMQLARTEGLLAVLPKPIPVARLIELLRCARRDGLAVLVEDDTALADNLTEALRARGMTAITASSIQETERLGDLHPFVALVDLRVPTGPDGEALRKVAERFPRLPILVMTGLAEVPAGLPVRKVFTKPFDSAAMFQEIERAFEDRAR